MQECRDLLRAAVVVMHEILEQRAVAAQCCIDVHHGYVSDGRQFEDVGVGCRNEITQDASRGAGREDTKGLEIPQIRWSGITGCPERLCTNDDLGAGALDGIDER